MSIRIGPFLGKRVCKLMCTARTLNCLANDLDIARAGLYNVTYQTSRRNRRMNVKFPFDNAAAERRGYTLETVRQMIKNLFAAHGLPCVSDGDALAFRDKGHNDDFTTMWDIILFLLRSNWFLDCDASCIWLDEDGEEDILAQVGKA